VSSAGGQRARRKRVVPEVVQTSGMDCGPAALSALMEGFGMPVSYGRLREACQTTVDGTSITTIAEVARQLGLDAEEVMMPADHVLLPEANALPALAVVYGAGGSTHFTVIWSAVGPWVQIMDPAQGRMWISRRECEARLFVHANEVSVAGWRQWVEGDEFQRSLDACMARLGMDRKLRARLRAEALAVPGWRGVAALDAATRMVGAMVGAGGLRAGGDASALVARLAARARVDADATSFIPNSYWSVLPASPGDAPGERADDDETVLLRGAVLVHAGGWWPDRVDRDALTPELREALAERPEPAWRTLARMLREDGLATPLALVVTVVVAAASFLLTSVILREVIALGAEFPLFTQRVGIMAALVALLVLGFVLEVPVITGGLALGRALELRVRMAFLGSLPHLDDRYFRSRLVSDMAERGHSLHLLRGTTELGRRFLSGCAQIVLTAAGIAWLAPAGAPWALLAVALTIGLPLLFQPLMAERELRVRNHLAALSRFYLDALLGLVPVRVHGAGLAVRRAQEDLLVQWSHAGMRLQSAATWVEGALAACGFGVAAVLVITQATGGAGDTLLLAYWALGLPALGQQVAIIARQYPLQRNIVMRVLEQLHTPRDPELAAVTSDAPARDAAGGHAGDGRAAAVDIRGVTVRAGGHEILRDVDLTVAPGSHVAIVGPSGAGKSSLAGLLLGWHRPIRGRVEVDGRVLAGAWLVALRQQTAWVDPEVRLWNRSFLDNLRYGAEDEPEGITGMVLDQAALRDVLEALPEGLQSHLGEGGSLVSGGEGQRVRFGRGLMRRQARLVILDEPFRGLDRARRRALLTRARAWWPHATLLWITHDVAETAAFDRVLVIEDGRVAEDGAPAALLGREGSRYRALVQADEALRSSQWGGPGWRRLRLEDGVVREASAEELE
jgi:ATP-binding cassette subfamily B protein